MPDSDQTKRDLGRWVEGKMLGNAACTVCGANEWQLGPVFELREFHGGNLVIGKGGVLPIAPLTCGNCGNTLFFNAIVAGLVETAGEPAPPESAT